MTEHTQEVAVELLQEICDGKYSKYGCQVAAQNAIPIVHEMAEKEKALKWLWNVLMTESQAAILSDPDCHAIIKKMAAVS